MRIQYRKYCQRTPQGWYNSVDRVNKLLFLLLKLENAVFPSYFHPTSGPSFRASLWYSIDRFFSQLSNSFSYLGFHPSSTIRSKLLASRFDRKKVPATATVGGRVARQSVTHARARVRPSIAEFCPHINFNKPVSTPLRG